MDAATRALDAEILSFIRRYPNGSAPDAAFNALALKLFRHQFERNAPYRRWCASEGRNPANVGDWKEIPAVPALAFKRLRLAAFPKKKEIKIFRTSGTTAAGRGRHFFDTLKLYEAAIVPAFRRHLLADGAALSYYFLMPPAKEAPDSSLSHMMGVVNRVFGRNRGRFYVKAGKPDFARLTADLKREKGKVFLLATAFALKGFLDHLAETKAVLRLKAGSRLMETGGFKGRTVEVSKKALHRLCEKYLGVSAKKIVSEYGMTELSSQYYDGVPPSWMRAIVVDPATGREAKRGQLGLLRHVDLANRGSVSAIETQDLGFAKGKGVRLIGRAPAAEKRGCSLAFEDFLKK